MCMLLVCINIYICNFRVYLNCISVFLVIWNLVVFLIVWSLEFDRGVVKLNVVINWGDNDKVWDILI